MTDRRLEFLTKLRDLLAEYNVSISASYDGDTHGIYDERITIDHRPDPNSFKEVEWLRLHYPSITAHDLTQEINP